MKIRDVGRTFAVLSLCTASLPAQRSEPGPRVGHGLVFDESLGAIVLVDGYLSARARPAAGSQPEFTELWKWDGVRWALLVDSGFRPRARSASSVVYDVKKRRIVSYGGTIVGQNPRREDDTWEWDGRAWRIVAESGPCSRNHQAAAYDFARARTVMFGGECSPPASGSYPGDTWELDGDAWRRSATEGPTGRISAMAYDAQREVLVLFGGVGAIPSTGAPQPEFTDTWVWSGLTWQRAAEVGPPPRAAYAMAWDGVSSALVLYGGAARSGELGDMWKWDGTRWAEIRLSGPSPGPRQGHAMVYDPARRRVVLYGGSACPMRSTPCNFFDDTWEWDGTTWTRLK